MNTNKELLKINDLEVSLFSQGETAKILKGVSFTINRGEIVSIAGESGCGKTITVLSIIGLLPNQSIKATGGKIFYDKVDLLELSDKELLKLRRKNISIIFQDPFSFLDPVFRVGDQISEVVMLNNKKIGKQEAKEKSIELLNKVGISDAEKRYLSYPHQLSGGMAQRVMIAIAIASQPQLLICDEATSALDVTTQKQILSFLKDLAKDDISIIFVSHDLSVVSEISDRIIIMYAGEIMEIMEGGDLFTNSKHPYTRSLIRSLPKFGVKEERLTTIEGSPPDIFEDRKGCAFKDRCKFAIKECFEGKIVYKSINSGHLVRCLL